MIKYYKDKLVVGQVYMNERNEEFLVVGKTCNFDFNNGSDKAMLNIHLCIVDGSDWEYWENELLEGRLKLVGELEK